LQEQGVEMPPASPDSQKNTKKMNTGMEAASKDGGQSEFGFVMPVDDFVKLAKAAKCKDSAVEGKGLADNAPVNAAGQVTFEALFRYCVDNGSIDECPSGASFKAQAWQDFQAWWEMRLIFKQSDKDMSGTLSMDEVRACRRPWRPPLPPQVPCATLTATVQLLCAATGGPYSRWTTRPNQVGVGRHAAGLEWRCVVRGVPVVVEYAPQVRLARCGQK
jgi:hypothetical protein